MTGIRFNFNGIMRLIVRYISSSILLLSIGVGLAFGQSERKSIREGNKEFKKDNFVDAEVSYRSALDQNPESYKANFNLGDALYKQEKFEESAQLFNDLSDQKVNDKDKAKIYHNLGNTLFKQQKFGESVEAYKNSLRCNPKDMETKYNLAQAQRMLLQQQQQQQQQQNQEGGDDKKDDKQDNNQQKDNKQDKQDDKQQNQQQQQDQQKQEQQEQQISPEDARRMLEAIQNTEQDVQERVRAEQAKQKQVRVEKNW